MYLSAIVNHAAVNKSVQVSLGEPAFDSLEYIPGSGIGEVVHMEILFVIFLTNSNMIGLNFWGSLV